MPTEEENAAAYRAKCANRRAYTAERLRALQGDPEALAALNERWAPFIEELRGTEPVGPCCFPEDCRCPPVGQPRILYYS